MSDERAAAAALAIERYVAGLRGELGVLKPEDSAELAREIGTMLVDAARHDPEQAFAEMERLGEPWRLAAALLAERGITTSDGVPAASWWRLGVAAAIDIVLGLAAPMAVAVWLFSPVWQSLVAYPGVAVGASLGKAGIVVALCALAAVLTWRAWSPWRSGGRAITSGMAIAQIAVVRLGGTRVVVRQSDLRAAGLDSPALTNFTMLATLASVALAVLLLAGATSAVSTPAADPLGASIVTRFAGPESTHEVQVRSAASQLYGNAMLGGGSWPLISDDEGLDTAKLKAALVGRFFDAGDPPAGDFVIGQAYEDSVGVWTVTVAEMPAHGAARTATLTYAFHMEWMTDIGPDWQWALVGYK